MDWNHIEAFLNLGIAYYELDEIDKAADCFEEILWLNPEHTQANYYLRIIKDK